MPLMSSDIVTDKKYFAVASRQNIKTKKMTLNNNKTIKKEIIL